jgi:hypothetical protein
MYNDIRQIRTKVSSPIVPCRGYSKNATLWSSAGDVEGGEYQPSRSSK